MRRPRRERRRREMKGSVVKSDRRLQQAERQTKLLEAAARVSQTITSILDLDALLETTIDAICKEFGFYYAGIFLLDETGRRAELRAGKGEPGQTLVAENHALTVGGQSMVGLAIVQRRAMIAADVGQVALHLHNPHLPETQSEVALPLIVGQDVIGALTIQSKERATFSEQDVAALQATADQLAIAINNARLLDRLEETHQELVRTKTYEAIANATGESIHWVGNKAAPIPGSAARVREDVSRYLAMAIHLLEQAPPPLQEHTFGQFLIQAGADLAAQGIDVEQLQAELATQSPERLARLLRIESILEDLEIIEQSARAILNIKEDLLGPARQREMRLIHLPNLLESVIEQMAIPQKHVRTLFAPDLQPVRADPAQLRRVFNNLIKNAVEAMEAVEDKTLFVWARQDDEPGFVVVDVIDNGVGIPPDQLDKIWMAFYTTKGGRGGTGLGLPACVQIVSQLNGKITVDSEVGLGATFSVHLPAARAQADR